MHCARCDSFIREEVGSCPACGLVPYEQSCESDESDESEDWDDDDDVPPRAGPSFRATEVPCPFCGDLVTLLEPGAAACAGCGNAFTVDYDFMPVGDPMACGVCGAGFLAAMDVAPTCPRCGEAVSLDDLPEYSVTKIVCPRSGEVCYVDGPEGAPCPVCGILG